VALETWQKGAEVTMVIRKEELYEKVKYWILPNIQNRIKEGSIKAYFSSTLESIKESSVDILTPDGRVTIDNDYDLAMTGYRPDYGLLDRLGLELEGDNNKTPIYNPQTYESNLKNVYIAGTLLGGLYTSKFFIENTRQQSKDIIHVIKNKTSLS